MRAVPGTAAYKTVELDDYLGGAATQYRETEHQMSRKFQALFNNRIVILEGGIESGFNAVEENAYPKRLLHVKGGMNTLVKQVPVSWESLNSGDSFILDTGNPVKDKDGKVKQPVCEKPCQSAVRHRSFCSSQTKSAYHSDPHDMFCSSITFIANNQHITPILMTCLLISHPLVKTHSRTFR